MKTMKHYLLNALLLALLSCLSHIAFCQQGVLYSQTFGNGCAGCTIIDSTGSAQAWLYSQNPIPDPYVGGIYFFSPTENNGFAAIMTAEDTNLVATDLILPAIDCSGQTQVSLQFYEWYTFVSGTVSLSTDSINWTPIYSGDMSTASTDGVLMQIDISSYAANQPKVYIDFHFNNSSDYLWAIDDIYVTDLPINNAVIDSLDITSYAPANSSVPIQAEIYNADSINTLNSITLTYTVNGNSPVTETFNFLGIPSLSTGTVLFQTNAQLGGVGAYNISVSSSMPNGNATANTTRNTYVKQVVTLSKVPNRNVLLEAFSFTNCEYCPGADIEIQQIRASADSSSIFPVILHVSDEGDPMSTSESSDLGVFSEGSPEAAIDREPYQGGDPIAIGVCCVGTTENDWQTNGEAERLVPSPASISASNTYNSLTGALTVTVSSTFYGPARGDFRLNCYIIEDSVVGPPGSSYDQNSDYYNGPSTGNPYYQVGNLYDTVNGLALIPGFVHNSVDRMLMNGSWGDANGIGYIPSPTTDGATYTQTYTTTLDPSWRTQFIRLTAFVCNYSGYENNSYPPGYNNADYFLGPNTVWNAVTMPLNSQASSEPTGIAQPSASTAKMTLYPNPTSGSLTVDLSGIPEEMKNLIVYDMTGRAVINMPINENSSNKLFTINTTPLGAGVYVVEVTGNTTYVQKIVKTE
jgi:hypothetical protein